MPSSTTRSRSRERCCRSDVLSLKERNDQMAQRDERDRTTAAAQRRAVRHARRLADLLARRPDLEGVYPPADLTAEAVRWSV